MTSSTDKKQNRKLRKLANSILKRENDRLEVKGYKLGDIQSELDVYVAKKAALAGNVLAPKVMIAGIIYGFVASREVIVESMGQIWGDVHSVALKVAPGGKVHGWMSTLDEGTVDLLRSGELSTVDLENSIQRMIPQEILDILPGDVVLPPDGRETEPRLLIWRQLRAEAALALLARSEIESTFERRLVDLVNSIPTKSATEQDLEAELDRMRKLSYTAISQATDYHNQYLKAQENLEEAQKALEELQNAGRDVELKEAREKANRLAEELKQTRRLATNRIRRLENELARRT